MRFKRAFDLSLAIPGLLLLLPLMLLCAIIIKVDSVGTALFVQEADGYVFTSWMNYRNSSTL